MKTDSDNFIATRVKFWLPLLLWLAGMVAATSIPGDRLPAVKVPGIDKAAHVLMYGGLAFLLQRELRGGLKRPLSRPLLLAAFFCLAYGLLDEVHQLAIPKRTFSLGDLAADAVGIAIGLAIAAGVTARRPPAEDIPTGINP